MTIRPCRPEEARAVLDLWRRAEAIPSATDSAAELRRLARAPQAAFLVAEADGALVGSVVGGWDGWRGAIYRLAVAPEQRRRGLGRALVRAAEERLRALGARRLSALVERQEAHAVGFWNALAGAGWTADPRMLRYVKTLGP